MAVKHFGNKSPLRAVRAMAVIVAVGTLALPGYGQAKKAQASESSAAAAFTDTRDGKTYRAVKIGEQTWMAENLNYKTDSSWCSYGADSNCAKYGRLYTWDAAMKACPAGWHLPGNDEWNKLVSAAGGDAAGKKLKSKAGWEKNGNGTDDYGFSAMPGGRRFYSDSTFNFVGDYGNWWSAAETGSATAYCRIMGYNNDRVNGYSYYKDAGFSVRCIRDK